VDEARTALGEAADEGEGEVVVRREQVHRDAAGGGGARRRGCREGVVAA